MTYEHLIDLNDWSVSQWNKIVELALHIKEHEAEYAQACKGKILATLFYEPSTRTQMSFQTAMLKLGGQIIGFDNPQNSSVSKGENLTDTIRIVSGYADILAIRHPLEGAAKAAALYADCPVINAGDGGHLHPTQTLTDLVTLKSEKGRLSGLTIGLCGDLKNGRTVHSLIKALSLYPDNRFILISTRELGVPQYIKDWLNGHSCDYQEVYSLSDAMPMLDVLYMTRIQKERFSSDEEYEKQKNVYILDTAKLFTAKQDLCILHPLPRVDEIDLNVDKDPRAIYFKQAVNGVYARMALILTLLQSKNHSSLLSHHQNDIPCNNPKCITNHETYLEKSYKETGDMLVCEYCDDRQLI
jgi:aspartate carbamoyltransferase catalytic subunit